MAPLRKSGTIQHFTHPHPLTEHQDNQEFLCDGCRVGGAGKRYRCIPCQFDLHDFCATCPATLSSFMHPQHPLALVVRKPQSTRQITRICDVCRENVDGLFYRCKICEFDVHPLCTQLPQHVRHVLHPPHSLSLQTFTAGSCKVCLGNCDSWRYRCASCCVDIHVDCVLAQCDTSKTRGLHPPGPHQHGGFPYSGYPNPGSPHQHGGIPYSGYPNPGSPHQNGGFPHGAYPNPGGFGPYYQNGNNQVQRVPGSSTGKKMSMVVQKLTMGVVSSIIFGSASDFLTNSF